MPHEAKVCPDPVLSVVQLTDSSDESSSDQSILFWSRIIWEMLVLDQVTAPVGHIKYKEFLLHIREYERNLARKYMQDLKS